VPILGQCQHGGRVAHTFTIAVAAAPAALKPRLRHESQLRRRSLQKRVTDWMSAPSPAGPCRPWEIRPRVSGISTLVAFHRSKVVKRVELLVSRSAPLQADRDRAAAI